MMSMRRYLRGQLKAVFQSHNLRERELKSLGFGPLTFRKREFLPVGLSLKINRCLECLAEHRALSFLNLFANHFVFCLQKK